ncbi:MAG: hypothetical protein AABX73_01580 [Nanoarchaeota archaeon]
MIRERKRSVRKRRERKILAFFTLAVSFALLIILVSILFSSPEIMLGPGQDYTGLKAQEFIFMSFIAFFMFILILVILFIVFYLRK